ncbi:MAG: LysO family transporter [Tannerellaceae bacterium]|nr:LysO family transporter [Tannerellaceae bacterium]
MFIVIGIMFLGIALGYLLRKVKGIENLSKSISFTILLLLFLLGVSVGGNPEIVSNLSTLGWQAFLLAFAGTLGSVVAAGLVYRFLFKKHKL